MRYLKRLISPGAPSLEAFYTHVISAPSLHRASTDALYTCHLIFFACLHTFDVRSYSNDWDMTLCAETWTVQATTGEKPPPLYDHTLTITGRHRSTVFGGNSGGRRRHNDTYVLDMETWVRML